MRELDLDLLDSGIADTRHDLQALVAPFKYRHREPVGARTLTSLRSAGHRHLASQIHPGAEPKLILVAKLDDTLVKERLHRHAEKVSVTALV